MLVVFMLIGSQTAFLGKVYDGSVWETRVVLQSERVVPELTRVAMAGDSWWYRSIALHGYDRRAEAGKVPNWAFFPLYPLLVRTLSFTGNFALDGALLSNVAFAGALLLLGALTVRSGLSVEDAERAVFYLAFFPTSYFLSLPMTEALFLFLTLGSMLAGLSRRWWLAGVVGGFAALTRFAGILLIVPLAIEFVRIRERPRWKVLWLGLVPAGTAAFMAHLHAITGDALAFIHVQRYWSRGTEWFLTPLYRYVTQPQKVGEPWNLIALNFAIALLLFVVAAVLLYRRQWAFGAYTLLSVLLPLFSGSLQSIARYGMVVFPLYCVLAIAGRRPGVDRVILAVSVALWGWLVAMFVSRVDYALS